MKKTAGILFFILFILLFSAAGVLSLFKAYQQKALPDPAEGAASMESWANRYLPGRKLMLAPYRVFNAAAGRRYYPETDSYISPEGQILIGSAKPSLRFAVGHVTELAARCRESGIPFLYVVFPGKPRDDRELTDLGISCYRNFGADSLTAALEEAEIPYLDLREIFAGEPDYYRYFYKTEHHWTADAGLKAAQALVDHLNKDLHMELDAGRIAEDRIGRKVLPGAFVGESGMKLLGRYGERDDFIIRYPLYQPHLRYVCPEDSLDLEGGFEVLTDEAALSEDHLDGGRSLYYYYLFKNSGLVEIWDSDVAAGDLLLIKDSFSNVVTPFLALAANHVTTWDMRNSPHLYSYLDEHPETGAVLVAYTLSFIPTKAMNDFQ